MSISMRTAKMNVHPQYYEGKHGLVFSCDVVEPKNYRMNISPETGLVKQHELALRNCADNGQEVEIEYAQTTDNWGKQSFVIYSVKPLNNPSKP